MKYFLNIFLVKYFFFLNHFATYVKISLNSSTYNLFFRSKIGLQQQNQITSTNFFNFYFS